LPIFDPKNVRTLYHPPYSPDLSPPDYFLFPKLKINLKGLHFADVAEVQEAVTDELKRVQKEEFGAAFQKMYNRANACIYANGAYFELKKRHVSSIFKNAVLKLLDRTAYISWDTYISFFLNQISFQFLSMHKNFMPHTVFFRFSSVYQTCHIFLCTPFCQKIVFFMLCVSLTPNPKQHLTVLSVLTLSNYSLPFVMNYSNICTAIFQNLLTKQ